VPDRPGDRSLAVADGADEVLVHVPPQAATSGRRLPLVIALHGSGSTGAQLEAVIGLDAVADRRGFVAAYPSAPGRTGSWTLPVGSSQAGRDVALLRATIAAVARTVCLDRRRVAAAGVSNGGRMAVVAGCRMADKLAAVIPVAGGFRRLPRCRPARPVSVLVIHGTADPVAPYRGRDGEGDVVEVVERWARRDRCEDGPVRRREAPGVVRLAWRDCARGTRVEQLRVAGGGHGWPPGATPPSVDLDASEEVWRFLRAVT